MGKEIKLDKLYSMRIQSELLERYKVHCDDNGLLLSKRLRFLIEKDIESKLTIL